MDGFDWDDLRLFLAVARAESLAGAGKAVRLDPATVGRRIARFEERTGARLFTRSPHGYALTAEGQRLLEHAVGAEVTMAEAQAALRGTEAGLSGQVRVGAPDGCATYVLPQVLAAIADLHPALEVQIVAQPRVFNLSKREADMAIAVSRPSAGRLVVQKITDYHLSLAAAQGYLAAHAPLAGRADLARHRAVGYIPDMIFDRELDYRADTGLPLPALASNAMPVQLALLREGAGIGVVHEFALPFLSGLVRVLPGEVRLTRSFHLVRHADDRRVERLNRFAALLAAGIRREVARLEALV